MGGDKPHTTPFSQDKEALTSGTNFFLVLDVNTLYRLLSDYFDRKAQYLEHRHLDRKATGASTKATTVQMLSQAAPRMLEHVAQQIPADHPNAAALRQKLTITKAREARGLITPEQASKQRAEARQATQRKGQVEWICGPEAKAPIEGKS